MFSSSSSSSSSFSSSSSNKTESSSENEVSCDSEKNKTKSNATDDIVNDQLNTKVKNGVKLFRTTTHKTNTRGKTPVQRKVTEKKNSGEAQYPSLSSVTDNIQSQNDVALAKPRVGERLLSSDKKVKR